MEGIIAIVVIYFLISVILKHVKTLNVTKQTQQETEASKRPPVKPPVAKKKADFRFPSAMKSMSQPMAQEGRDPKDELKQTYTPIAPSMDLESRFSDYSSTVRPSADLQNQFSEYQGSLGAAAIEGSGYQAEKYDPVPVVYSTEAKKSLHVLPETFTRDTLVQAVVMSEILKRPRALQ